MDLKSAANMAQFNSVNNAAKNSRAVIERAAKALSQFGVGSIVQTSQLNTVGYDKNAITRLKNNGVIKKIKNGWYEIISLN